MEQGKLKNYAEAAGVLGVTRARMARIMSLLYLSPALQEAILDGRLVVSERQLLPALRHESWGKQEASIPCNHK